MPIQAEIAIALLANVLLVSTAVAAGDGKQQMWDFNDEKSGEIPTGFTGYIGNWLVVDSEGGKALAQTATNSKSTFNVALINNTNAKDVDISVRMRAIAGKIDQGGGIVWRAQDAKNYYLVRYNPLENNFRLYKVIDGQRALLQNVDIMHSDGWHTLRVVMSGDYMECYYDGNKYLKHEDSSITASGKVGLWSKADAQSHFDELTISEK